MIAAFVRAVFALQLVLAVSDAFRVQRGALTSLRLASSLEGADLDLARLVSKFKVVPFGVGGSDVRVSVECKDPQFRELDKKVTLSRVGGMGLDLLEADKLEGKGSYGLVVVGSVAPGSNAATPISGSFVPGDALTSVSGLTADGAVENKLSLEGLDFDATLALLGQFGAYDRLELGIKRLVPRNIIVVDVCGPDGVPYTKLKVLAGFGVNLRTVLQASNIRMYDDRTARFDAPYQTGNCGGEGTCGTCIVQVVTGASMLNERVRVEAAALTNQACPPNYRWSCRTIVGSNADDEGEVKIKLRPQSLL